ncbi:MAG: 2-oxoacid:acceptor oxidoreductase subunit alpha [Thermodesulfobacteriota bacterium]
MTSHPQQPAGISIVLGGEAGQGIQTIEELLTRILKREGYHVHATKEYMSRVRGGANSTSIRVAATRVQAPLERIDLLLPLDREVLPRLRPRLSEGTIIAGDSEVLATDLPILDVPFGRLAKEMGNSLFANTIALGLILGLLATDRRHMETLLTERFSGKGEETVAGNLRAAGLGYERGEELRRSASISLPEIARAEIDDEIMLNGSEAVALGAIAGGCRCVTSYPMTPGTGAFTFLARYARDFELLVEQAEDEIAAINMALGAWYAGGRAMVSTSGGGFALMTEGISLAGMLESPVVVHLAQRPGPATGLPTRTEQGDLQLALYAGHGDFPRILLAPETLADAFSLTAQAFNLADRYQVPVILLTDQYLVDTYYNTPAFALEGIEVDDRTVETDDDYRRYRITADGISPRGIPGRGSGLVCVDSDEHDEAGHITEDLALRVRMVDKRLAKLHHLDDEIAAPRRTGPAAAAILVVSWGSVNPIVAEALTLLDRDDVAHLGIRRPYPLASDLAGQLAAAQRTIIVEGNATAQLGGLIRRETGHRFDHAILQYNGLAFTVEQLVREIGARLQG